jgi:hypothetical protein
MLLMYAKGALLTIALVVGWWSIERSWNRTVAPALPEGRTGGCGNCMCTRRCEKDE